MKTLAFILFVLPLILLALCCMNGPSEASEDTKWVVHEWGVLIREQTTRGTMLCSPTEQIDDLPSFVLRHNQQYSPKRVNHGWDKPVVHCYGPEGLAVSFELATPMGRPTAYYPKPECLEKTSTIADYNEMMVYTLTDCSKLKWSGTITAKPRSNLVETPQGHWWQLIRKVPGLYFNTDNSSERFLFYEATAYQEPLMQGKVTETEVILKNSHKKEIGPVLLLINDGGKHFLRMIKSVPFEGSLKVSRETLLKEPADDVFVLKSARDCWESFGMTSEEAEAIVDTWKTDILGRPGFLLISRMPSEIYAQMFPLTVTPLSTSSFNRKVS